MNELHLFSGAGGGILGGMLLGHTCVCAVEIEPYPRQVLLQRQRDGILPHFPIWDDICTFDGRPWRGRVDIVAGGFPCQNISAAGNGAGLSGERSGLWSEMARVIGEVRPRFVFVENSPLLVSRGLDVVLSDLAEMGYNASWGIVGADDAGAPHRRKRIWIMGDADSQREPQQEGAIQDQRRRTFDTSEKQVMENARHGSGRDIGTTQAREDAQGERPADSDQTMRPGTEQSPMADTMQDGPQGERADRNTARQVGLRSGAWWDQDPAELPDTNSEGPQERQGQEGTNIQRIDASDRTSSPQGISTQSFYLL